MSSLAQLRTAVDQPCAVGREIRILLSPTLTFVLFGQLASVSNQLVSKRFMQEQKAEWEFLLYDVIRRRFHFLDLANV